MRYIEPAPAIKSPKKRRGVALLCAVILISSAAAIAIVSIQSGKRPNEPASENTIAAQTNSPSPDAAPVNPSEPQFKQFSGEDFKKLYGSFLFPNTMELSQPPEITGNFQADVRIRQFAERRGYVMRAVPVAPLVREDGLSLQQKAAKPWQDMKTAAMSDGILLRLVAGFRSVEDQRILFMSRLASSGIAVNAIADGTADTALDSLLKTTAIPGYSRHHTGFTIDIGCGEYDEVVFKVSRCYEWLSKDNYFHAKKFGWIPSYPEDTSDQGPDPESWEYVWVGTDALVK